MEFLGRIALVILPLLIGGSSIGGAINCYKHNQYGGCGVGIMFSFVCACFIIRSILLW